MVDGVVVMRIGLQVDDTLMTYADDSVLTVVVEHMKEYYGGGNIKVDKKPDTFLGISIVYGEDG